MCPLQLKNEIKSRKIYICSLNVTVLREKERRKSRRRRKKEKEEEGEVGGEERQRGKKRD